MVGWFDGWLVGWFVGQAVGWLLVVSVRFVGCLVAELFGGLLGSVGYMFV